VRSLPPLCYLGKAVSRCTLQIWILYSAWKLALSLFLRDFLESCTAVTS
jgi:hypothetical protein